MKRNALAITLLLNLTATAWCLREGLLDQAAWHFPIAYNGDTPQVMLHMKAASEGEFLPFMPKHVTRLGYPDGARFEDFPITEEPYFAIGGLLVKLFGVGVAFNLMSLLAHLTAALGMYTAVRWQGHARRIAVALGFAFAFSNFMWARSTQHLMLAFTWLIPWAIILVNQLLHIGTWSKREWRVAAFVTIAAGAQVPYYAFYLGLSIGFAWLITVAQAGLRAGNRALRVGLWLTAATLLWCIDSIVFWVTHGTNGQAIHRLPHEVSEYALRPIELFIPPPHHVIDAFSSWGLRWVNALTYGGEAISAYLGLVGIVGLLLLLYAAVRSTEHALWGFYLAWLLIWFVPGGLATVQTLLNSVWLRANNRVSVFILALALLALARVWRGLPSPRLQTIALGLILVVSWLEGAAAHPQRDLRARFATDEHTFATLEAKLPAGAAVFIDPARPYPEAHPMLGLGSYDCARPYLHTKTLRFDFGTIKGRTDDGWRYTMLDHGPLDAVAELKTRGFAAVCVARQAFKDPTAVIAKYEAAGFQFLPSGGEFSCATLP